MFVCPAGSFRLHLVLHEKVGEKQTMLAFFSWLKISTCNTKGIENRNQVCVTSCFGANLLKSIRKIAYELFVFVTFASFPFCL